MRTLLTISNPFQTVDEFQQRAGKRLGALIHRLASKYPQLPKHCGTKRMLLALSVAWALAALAKEGEPSTFEHIDEALSPPMRFDCVVCPPCGCVMVEGTPFFIAEEEQAVLRFLWDGFAIFIDHEGADCVGQIYFDFADTRQSKAYSAMQEEVRVVKNEEERAKSVDSVGEPFPVRENPQPCPPKEKQEDSVPPPPALPQREYLAELVDSVVSLGDERTIRALLTDFSYLPVSDAYLEHLRGILKSRLADFTANTQSKAPETHYHLMGNVGQLIARGDGIYERRGE